MKRKTALTPHQRKVFTYIVDSITFRHRPPTFREIAAFLSVTEAAARDVIDAMVKKGELIKDDVVSRCIRLNPDRYTVKVLVRVVRVDAGKKRRK